VSPLFDDLIAADFCSLRHDGEPSI
jgi:hypothetical protein